jgi:Protein of unknown function (DUF2934)
MARAVRKSNTIERTSTEIDRSAAEVTPDAIARRAYDLFLSRGATHGHDIDDWLEAERELEETPRLAEV